MVCPTGISAPIAALMPARMPSAGASTSTTALSVSISRSGSPLVTLSPSFLRQARSLPVSCAISRAGITTLMAISGRDSGLFQLRARFDHFDHATAGRRIVLTLGWQRAFDCVIVRARDHQLFGWETGDDFVAGFGNHD